MRERESSLPLPYGKKPCMLKQMCRRSELVNLQQNVLVQVRDIRNVKRVSRRQKYLVTTMHATLLRQPCAFRVRQSAAVPRLSAA